VLGDVPTESGHHPDTFRIRPAPSGHFDDRVADIVVARTTVVRQATRDGETARICRLEPERVDRGFDGCRKTRVEIEPAHVVEADACRGKHP
jgi:hypothetical protein